MILYVDFFSSIGVILNMLCIIDVMYGMIMIVRIMLVVRMLMLIGGLDVSGLSIYMFLNRWLSGFWKYLVKIGVNMSRFYMLYMIDGIVVSSLIVMLSGWCSYMGVSLVRNSVMLKLIGIVMMSVMIDVMMVL